MALIDVYTTVTERDATFWPTRYNMFKAQRCFLCVCVCMILLCSLTYWFSFNEANLRKVATSNTRTSLTIRVQKHEKTDKNLTND